MEANLTLLPINQPSPQVLSQGPSPTKIINYKYCQDLKLKLGTIEREIITKVIKNGGKYPIAIIDNTERKFFNSLLERGILKKERIDNSDVYIMPLEYSIGFSTNEYYYEPNGYLLEFFNRMSGKFIQVMAAHYHQPSFTDNLTTKTFLYKKILELNPKTIAELTTLELKILTVLLKYNNDISLGKLLGELRIDKDTHELRYGLENEIRDFYISPDLAHLNSKNILAQAFASLFYKGLIISFDLKFNAYSYNIKLKVPLEFFETTFVKVFEKYELEKNKLKQELKAETPEDPISYENRVLDDIVKMQIYRVCRPTEYTQSGQITRRYIKNLVSFFKEDPQYLELLFMNLVELEYLKGISQYDLQEEDDSAEEFDDFDDSEDFDDFEDEIDEETIPEKNKVKSKPDELNYDTFQLIKAKLEQYTVEKLVLKQMEDLAKDEGWLDILNFKKYLLAEKNLYKYWNYIDSKYNGLLLCLVHMGLVECKPQKSLRVSSLGKRILKNEATNVKTDIIKRTERPLIIQSNLEVLLPYNTEPSLIKELSEFLELNKIEKYLVFKITKEKLVQGLENNWSPNRIKKLFEDSTSKIVPPVIFDFINGILGKQDTATIAPCSCVITCKGKAIRERILSLKGLITTTIEGFDDLIIIHNSGHEELKKLLRKNAIIANVHQASLKERIAGDRAYYLSRRRSRYYY